MGKKRSSEDIKFLRRINEICTRDCEELIEKVAISYNLSQIGIISDKYKEVLNNRFRESIKKKLRKVYVDLLPNPTIIRRMSRRNEKANEVRIDRINAKILSSINNQKERIVADSAFSILLQTSKALKLNGEFRNWYTEIKNLFLSEEGSNLFLTDYVLLEGTNYETKKNLAIQVMSLVSNIIRASGTSGLVNLLTEDEINSQSQIMPLSPYINSDIFSSYLSLIKEERDRREKERAERKSELERKLEEVKKPEKELQESRIPTMKENPNYIELTMTKGERKLQHDLERRKYLTKQGYEGFISFIKSKGVNSEYIVDYLVENRDSLYSIREEVLEEISKRNFNFDEYVLGGIIQDPKRREIAKYFNLPHRTRFEYETDSPYFKDERAINRKIRYERKVKTNEPKIRVATN